MPNISPPAGPPPDRLAEIQAAADSIERLATAYFAELRPLRESLQAVADVPLQDRAAWAEAIASIAHRLSDLGMSDVPGELRDHSRWEDMSRGEELGASTAGKAFCVELVAAVNGETGPAGFVATLERNPFIDHGGAVRQLCIVLSRLMNVRTGHVAPRFANDYLAVVRALGERSATIRDRLRHGGRLLSIEATAAIRDWDQCGQEQDYPSAVIRPSDEATARLPNGPLPASVHALLNERDVEREARRREQQADELREAQRHAVAELVDRVRGHLAFIGNLSGGALESQLTGSFERLGERWRELESTYRRHHALDQEGSDLELASGRVRRLAACAELPRDARLFLEILRLTFDGGPALAPTLTHLLAHRLPDLGEACRWLWYFRDFLFPSHDPRNREVACLPDGVSLEQGRIVERALGLQPVGGQSRTTADDTPVAADEAKMDVSTSNVLLFIRALYYGPDNRELTDRELILLEAVDLSAPETAAGIRNVFARIVGPTCEQVIAKVRRIVTYNRALRGRIPSGEGLPKPNPPTSIDLATIASIIPRLIRAVDADEYGAMSDTRDELFHALTPHSGWTDRAIRESDVPDAAKRALARVLGFIYAGASEFRLHRDDGLDLLNAALAAITAPPPEGTAGEQGNGPLATRGKRINERMLATIQSNPESLNWSAQQWADHLVCVKSTVVETTTWKTTIRAAQTMEKARRDLERKGKGGRRRTV